MAEPPANDSEFYDLAEEPPPPERPSPTLKALVSKPAVSPTQDPVTDELTCLSCGYLLRGLEASAACPECGLLVATSRLRRGGLALAGTGYLRKAMLGLNLMTWVLGIAPVLFYMVLPVLRWGGVALPEWLDRVVVGVMVCVFMTGSMLLTHVWPGGVSISVGRFDPRPIAYAAGPVSLALGLVLTAIMMWLHVHPAIASGLFMMVQIAGTMWVVALLLTVARVAKAIEREGLSMSATGLSAVCLGLSVLILAADVVGYYFGLGCLGTVIGLGLLLWAGWVSVSLRQVFVEAYRQTQRALSSDAG